MFRHRLPGRGHAVRVLQMRHPGAKLIEHEFLIIHPAIRRAITPAENHRAVTLRSRNQFAKNATIGVFPVPPVVRFPTLITGTAAGCARLIPQSNNRLRQEIPNR